METSPLSGRREEIALLKGHCADAKQGAGRVVLLSGEASTDKTRPEQR